MATPISDLGNGIGFIYVTTLDGVNIINNIENTPAGARSAKALAVQSAAVAVNKASVGSIVIGNPSGVGVITQVLINAINQINANINFVGADTEAAIALLVAAGINSFTPGTGPDYIAKAIDDIVYLFSPIDDGASTNGEAITVSITANLTVTTTDMEGGQTGAEVADQTSGYGFWIDSDYGVVPAVEGVLTYAEEITNSIIPISMQSSLQEVSATIASGELSVTRVASTTQVIVDTEGAAATDDLTGIIPMGFAQWDILIIRGADVARVVTVKTTENIGLAASVDFISGADSDTLTLQYKDGSFYETSRSTATSPSVATLRAAGIPIGLSGATATTIPAGGGLKTLVVGTDTQGQGFEGGVVLLANYTVALSNAGAIAGDMFYISYTGKITTGAFTLLIGDVTFTVNMALYGKIQLTSYYTGAIWETNCYYNVDNSANKPKIETQYIGDAQVTAAKVQASLSQDILTTNVSFETGELGTYTMIVPFNCTVTTVSSQNTKLIEATNNATIDVQDNAAASMGTITHTAGSAFGVSVQTITPTVNKTFTAGQTIRFVTAKVTAGGKASIIVTLQKT